MNSIILYKNIFTATGAVITSRSLASGYSLASIYDYKAYTRYQNNPAGDFVTEWIEVALPEEEVLLAAGGLPIETAGGGTLLSAEGAEGVDSPDCIGIFNHNLGTLGAVVKVQRQNTSTEAWEDLLEFTPENDKTILRTFDPVNSYKYRIFFTLPDTDLIIRISQIYLGQRLDMPNRPSGPLSPVEESIVSKSEVSKSGYTLGSLIAHHPLAVNHIWRYITRAWYETYFEEFYLYAKTLNPFFYAWDLDERPNDVVFVRLDEGFIRREQLSMLHYNDELQLQMRSIGN